MVTSSCADSRESKATDAPAAYELEPVVITAPAMETPLEVQFDPKAAQQPIPPQDGAAILKTVPGFSVIRKGGTDGDPVFRGMSGSRLGILLDGQQIFGGCGGRMDPPTAYVYPDSYDRVTVLKGPQNVTSGPGYSAGVVLFEREFERFERPGIRFYADVVGGSFGRHDEIGDITAGNQSFYVRAIGTNSHSDDYKDGDGRKVHSNYTRWSLNGAIGWTPDKDTRLELSGAKSDGKAAYADRGMDGSKFARNNAALKFEKKNLSRLVEKVEAQLYYNYVDHVMDNYSLRTPGATVMAMNVDRRTTGGRLAATLGLAAQTKLIVGADAKQEVHSYRDSKLGLTSGDAATANYLGKGRIEDMRLDQIGLFGELAHSLASGDRLVGGLRVDHHKARDGRFCMGIPDDIGTGCAVVSGPMAAPMSDTHGMTDRRTLPSGFIRYEGSISRNVTWVAGLGHGERFPDYWEHGKLDPSSVTYATGKSVLMNLKPEKTTQLDVGGSWKAGEWSGSLSGFYNKIVDYILIRWMPAPSGVARNIDATTYGFEGDLAYRLSPAWTATAAVAYVHGNNDTDDKPLAQQQPLEFRLGAQYDNHVYSFGALWRIVASQDRFDVGSGNIVMNGMDIGQTPGFGVFSINAGWRPMKNALLTAGIDNLIDKTYAEHLSRTGAAAPGYLVPANTRINEPGRTFWVKATYTF